MRQSHRLRPLLQPFKYAYRELISNRTRQIPFWILVGFLPIFALARFVVRRAPDVYLMLHGVHVHHYTYGIIALAVVCFISLVTPTPNRILAVAYGASLAMAFDEFAMWVQLSDNYRLDLSEDVMVGILVTLVFIVYGVGILRRAWPSLRKAIKRF